MTYRYDVFLSYRRSNEWPRYVERIFVPMLRHWLSTELGRTPEIFLDVDRIETGMQWPAELAAGVASSRVMVSLWSKEYFSSDWCMAELSHMLARRQAFGANDPPPLVLAAVIHDGEDLPAELDSIQQFPIQKYANPWMRSGSPREEKLSEKLKRLAGHVASAIDKAPAYDSSWQTLAVDQFTDLFHRKKAPAAPPSLGRTPR